MRKPILLVLLLAAVHLAGSFVADAASTDTRTVTGAGAGAEAGPAPIGVRDDGLVAEYYAPRAGAPAAAILVLDGSEGGIDGARRLAGALSESGHAALAVAYFGAEGLPGALQEIPIEYFKRALDWLRARREVDAKRIAVVGVSKGAEAALIVAATYPQVAAVVAGVPSHVAWQSINFRDWTPRASWTLHGKAMAYVPYAKMQPWPLVALYAASLKQQDAVAEATIAVERINGPILLVSGGQDQIWPSQAMAEAIVARLDARHFGHRVEHLAYPDAGHGVFGRPIAADDPRAQKLTMLGGSVEGNLAARADAWPKVLAFLDEALAP
jgi:hypothetical protein